jgi:hypothetical protein
LDPVGTVTLAGVIRAALVLAIPTDVGVVAILSRSTVQVANWLLPSVDGLQNSVESDGATKAMLAVRTTPFRFTVTVAV